MDGIVGCEHGLDSRRHHEAISLVSLHRSLGEADMSDTERPESQTSSQQPATELTVPDRLARERLPVPTAGDPAAGRNQPTSPDIGSTPEDVPARTKFIDGTHSYICEYIKIADQ